MSSKFKAFYYTCFPAGEYQSLLAEFAEDEKGRANAEFQSLCNYVVWQLICQQLTKVDQYKFFDKQKKEYENDQLLSWLKKVSPGIEVAIKEVLERTVRSLQKEVSSYD